ncbi:MAG: GNAT family N-acetyltransferase, partial [Azoarcus sp.]|nr:GNAT family N-acetyltransferase [Azoarcus sp.]
VHDIAVLPAHRRRGLARALLAAAEEAARQRGCCKLTLEVLSNNHAAMAAYAQQGFAPYELDPAAGQAVALQKWL